MGRVVQSGEPAWTENDTALALEWQDWAAEICPGCGHHLSESTAETHEHAYEARDRVCFACEAKELRVKALSNLENAVTAGRKIGAVLALDEDG